MAYHGDDLDLRTPQTWSIPPSDLTGSPDTYANGSRSRAGAASYNRAAPIFVDDVVLACSNHAFDVAVAHRAGEVRLEHLLHALTRVDGASNALEARGIRVAGLRRESATIIAGEIPIGLGSGDRRPRRSDDFEQALRTASTIASRRNAPANVDDLLDALLDMPSDIPGIALLARHGGRIARDRLPQRDAARDREPSRDWDTPPLHQALPPLTRPVQSYAESRTPDYRAAPLPYYAPDRGAERAYDRPSDRGMRSDLGGSSVDSMQNARIEQLENAVRTLGSELSTDRKADRDDAHRFRGGLQDRLQSLEQSLMKVSDSDGGAGMLLDRLATVERGLEQRLNELSRPWSLLSERLQALEQTILDTRGIKPSDLQDRLASLEQAVTDRLKGVERKMDAAPAIDLAPIASRLDIIEEAVLNPAANHAESDKLAERMRLLEESINAQRAQVIQANAALNHDVKGLSAQAANLASGMERQRVELTGPLTERVGNIASILDGRFQTITGLLDRGKADVATLVDRHKTDTFALLDTRSTETQTALQNLTDHMAALESNLTLSLQKAADAQAIHTAELKEVHEALIKLNVNQHTLAGSIDQWRLDGVGDVSVIANRLDSIEKSSAKPVQMIEALTASVDNINRVTVERYHRRNRFWYWLFGTDDWVTASWPSQSAKIEAERAMLRGAAAASSGPKVSATSPVPPQALQRNTQR